MILIADIIARLKNECGRGFREISGANDFVQAQDKAKAFPSLYVMPASNRAGENTVMAGAIRQRINAVFTVAILTGAIGGSASMDDIQAREEDVMNALIGWTPPGASHFFTYVSGRLIALNLDQATAIWGSDFAAAYYLTKGTI